MRYLIFNITVLAALGYLLSSEPNQSFAQWAAVKLDVWSEPEVATKKADQGIVETGKTFAKAVAKATSDKLETLDPVDSDENIIVDVPEKNIELDVNKVKEMILDALKESQAAKREEKTTNKPELKPEDKTEIKTAVKTVSDPKASVEMNDAEIAKAFEAFEKREQPENTRPNDDVNKVVDAEHPVEKIPTFMTRAERAADMTRIIQQLNMLYLEKAGI
ncbi:MAG: hypothetical protein ACPH5J_08835 [Candidatus Puniceispirillum sp.]